jgi:phosphoribosylamine-glycine ligase
MLDLLTGKDTMEVIEEVACGVVMSQPDYPYYVKPVSEVSGVPIYGITKKNKDHLHPCEIMQGTAPAIEDGKIVNKEMWVTAGTYVLVVSGTGVTIEDAREECYKTVKEIKFPNSPMWRHDIGCRLEEQLPKLHKMGYAKDIEYGCE